MKKITPAEILVVSACVLGVIWAMLLPHDDTDPSREWWGRPRSGLALYTDAKTGCQYVKAGLFGGITPRLDEQGRPICRK